MSSPSPSLTLYNGPGSCSLVPHILLNHLSLPFQTVTMAFATREGGKWAAADGSMTHAEYVRKVNPAGLVPALGVGHGGDVIVEMAGLLNYIVLLAGGDRAEGLLGRTTFEKAQVAQWTAFLSGTLHGQGFGSLFRPQRFVGDERSLYEIVRAQGRKTIEVAFGRIEERLRQGDGRRFMVGNERTVVDFYMYVFYRWGCENGFDMLQKYSEYSRAAQELEGVEAVKETLKLDGLKACFHEDGDSAAAAL
ncbi:hypothetical protein JX265_011475 [Neoarthrinium moseri]|uniref:GST C-terminal domain-containing protein n=1 Tax=Neoarthrinium moseri TaxID=1658444 RepID=A0A9P9WCC1_9PEZI|nr:uncharacterized protein JN550_000994 [Neoarthrinium moseri]KAI1856834.1 hypothetical protein JX265_011475 [Neoarthrinium moseri]KAI1876922.1 hypothetical protein JN550_000994 [Neoarthrinium moseri]